MVNEFRCIGNLVKDPETKKAKDTNIVVFTVAVNSYKKDDVSYFSCIAFGKTGEAIGKYCKKGSKVYVSGSLHTRTYEGKNGKTFITEVIVDKCEFLSAKDEPQKKEAPTEEDTSAFPFEL